jgi:nitrogen fixation NifU-like protein
MSDPVYDDHILGHFREPYHRGHVQNPSIVHEEENPLCGDRVHLELLLDGDDHVREAWFDGHGCAISQAAQMLELLRVRLTPTRQKCGLLAFNVLKTMLGMRDRP